jgi:hypothetical protein
MLGFIRGNHLLPQQKFNFSLEFGMIYTPTLLIHLFLSIDSRRVSARMSSHILRIFTKTMPKYRLHTLLGIVNKMIMKFISGRVGPS